MSDNNIVGAVHISVKNTLTSAGLRENAPFRRDGWNKLYTYGHGETDCPFMPSTLCYLRHTCGGIENNPEEAIHHFEVGFLHPLRWSSDPPLVPWQTACDAWELFGEAQWVGFWTELIRQGRLSWYGKHSNHGDGSCIPWPRNSHDDNSFDHDCRVRLRGEQAGNRSSSPSENPCFHVDNSLRHKISFLHSLAHVIQTSLKIILKARKKYALWFWRQPWKGMMTPSLGARWPAFHTYSSIQPVNFFSKLPDLGSRLYIGTTEEYL